MNEIPTIAPVNVKALKAYRQLYNLSKDTNLLILIGGRGAGKTYEASKFVAFNATIKKKRCAVLRDEKSTIRDSIFNEISLRYDKANEFGGLTPFFEKNDTEIKERQTGKPLVFSKGFRASSNEKTGNMKGVSDIDIAIIEEAEDIRDKKKYDSFSDSIRKDGYLIIIILNTPDIEHWIVSRYFDTIEPDLQVNDPKLLDGYFKLVPKDIPGFVCIQSSYKDNVNNETGLSNLPANKIADYEGYGNPGHHLYDWHHYMTEILGYASAGRKGQVYTKFKPITIDQYLAIQGQEIFGQDFGTSSPAAFISVKFDSNNVYVRELNYLGKDNLEIGKMYCRLQLGADDVIIADSAEPSSIGKLRSGWEENELSQQDKEDYPQLLKGWNMYGVANKDIESGISTVKGFVVHCVGDNLWKEIRNYIYAQNKGGQYTNVPIKDWDHLLDCLRYVIVSRGRYF